MPVLIDHAPIEIGEGETIFGPANMPNGLHRTMVRFSRQTTATPQFWPEGITLTIMVQNSLDGGTTWLDVCGFTAEGGILPGKSGGEATESRCEGNFHVGTGRRGRVVANVSGGTLVSEVTLEVN